MRSIFAAAATIVALSAAWPTQPAAAVELVQYQQPSQYYNPSDPYRQRSGQPSYPFGTGMPQTPPPPQSRPSMTIPREDQKGWVKQPCSPPRDCSKPQRF